MGDVELVDVVLDRELTGAPLAGGTHDVHIKTINRRAAPTETWRIPRRTALAGSLPFNMMRFPPGIFSD